MWKERLTLFVKFKTHNIEMLTFGNDNGHFPINKTKIKFVETIRDFLFFIYCCENFIFKPQGSR